METMTTRYQFSNWILHNWSRAGLVLAVVLLALAPLVFESMGLAVFLIYLWLPLLMLHQYEEHATGELLKWYERRMPGIAPFLTERKLLLVNLGSGWLLFTIALYAAFFVHPGLGLAATYIALVNASMHIGQALRWRAYNPGLWTALILFIPGGVYTIFALSAAGATRAENLIGLGIGFLAHIFFFALGRGWILKTL
jgi:hypothetical protein